MTLDELYREPYSPMTDRPNVDYPHRAPILAETEYVNKHGVRYRTQVLTNRTKTRWWFEMSNAGWLHVYRTTTSKAKAEMWMAAVEVYQRAKETGAVHVGFRGRNPVRS